jgi:DNA polymerase-3 subunit epsilon
MKGLGAWRHARRCRRLAADCPNETLRGYLDAAGRLQVGALADTPIIAADLELTGLDPDRHHVCAVGWTLIDGGRIRIGGNRHRLVRADQSVGESATVHELLDHEVAEGVALERALTELFEAAAGRVWVFHHAPLDLAFLKNACERWAGMRPPFVVLDTLALERARRQRREQPVKPGELQLATLRETYHLPRYTAHNALIDAFATAELLLAMLAQVDGTGRAQLGSLVDYR